MRQVRWRSAVTLAAKVAVSGGLLGLVLANVDLDSILKTLRNADPFYVLLWYVSVPIANGLAAWRWTILAPHLSFATALKYTWIGVFFGQVLPGSILGDVAKGVSLALSDSRSRTGLASSIIAEKVIGLAALVLIFDFACAVIYTREAGDAPPGRQLVLMALTLSLLGVVGAGVATVLAFRPGILPLASAPAGLARGATHVATAIRQYAGQPALLIRTFGISLGIHAVYIVGTYISFLALGLEPGLLFAAIVYPVLAIVLLVPVTFSGIGLRDATLVMLFTLFGLSSASGVALSWLTLLTAVPNILIGGGIQLWEMYRRR
jgi:uncharacterized membrane protein YbhN (UPF0104 family)